MDLIKNRPSKEVAKYILLAQMNSDAGKDIYPSYYYNNRVKKFVGENNWAKALKPGYKMKDFYIQKAVSLILTNTTGFKFAYGEDLFENAVVYFQWHLYGTTFQTSFHTPSWRTKAALQYVSRFSIQWDRKFSREACIDLSKYMMGNY